MNLPELPMSVRNLYIERVYLRKSETNYCRYTWLECYKLLIYLWKIKKRDRQTQCEESHKR